MYRKLPQRPIYVHTLDPLKVPNSNIQRKEITRRHQHYVKRPEEPLLMNNHECPTSKLAHDTKERLATSSITSLADLEPPNLQIPLSTQLSTIKASVFDGAIKIGTLLSFVGREDIAKEATHKMLQLYITIAISNTFRVNDTHAKAYMEELLKAQDDLQYYEEPIRLFEMRYFKGEQYPSYTPLSADPHIPALPPTHLILLIFHHKMNNVNIKFNHVWLLISEHILL
eukprot:110071_1